MNPPSISYSLLQYEPDLVRRETVNVGVVIYPPTGPRVHLARAQGKLAALNPNMDLSRVYEQARRLEILLRDMWQRGFTPTQIANHINVGGGLSLRGDGIIQSDQELEQIVDELLNDLVSAPVKRRYVEPRTSRLHTELRKVFRDSKILGRGPSDIGRHLVVPNYPIDPDVGLFAEFALQNGRLHVTETVDFRMNSLSAKRQEAQAKTLLLIQARERLGASRLQRYVVVTGASESNIQASINLLGRHADDLIIRESAEDWQRYVDAMHKAARPVEGDLQ